MNCRLGDLAVVVRSDYAFGNFHVGRFVRCVAFYQDGVWPAWRTEPQLLDPHGDPFTGVVDFALRPIRDPGEDAKDETLHWLPVPTKEGQPA